MVKKVVITLAVLISIVLMFLISLLNGIRLGNFDFDNVNIQGLYLKYDKKLIIGTQSITIFNDDRTKSGSFRVKFGIEPFYDKYFISVEQFLMMDPYLNISGNIIIDLDNINLDAISSAYISDFSIQFHQNLKSVHADKCFVQYKKDSFYFSFENPSYANILLDESKVAIEKYEILKLELKSKEMVNSDLLSLLSNYDIKLPLKQINGENNTTVRLEIPFDIKKEIKASSDIKIKKGKVEIYGIPLYAEEMLLTLRDNKLTSKGKLLKRSKDHDLQYDIDTDFVLDFSQSRVDGSFTLNSGKFNRFSTSKSGGDFTFDFKDQFQASIELQSKSILQINEEKFYLTKAQSNYTDNNKTFTSNLKLQHIKYPLSIELKDIFNIEKTQSTGEGNLLLNKENNIVFSDTINYKTNFKDGFKLLFNIDTLQWYNNGSSYIVKDSKGIFEKEKIDSALKHIETLDSKSFIDNLELKYFNKIVTLKKEIFDNNILVNLDITNGEINGQICNDDTKCPKKVKIYGNIYSDKPYIQIPQWGGEYRALDKKHFIVKLSHPSFLKEFFNFLTFHKKSSLYIDKKKGMTSTAYVKNIDFDFKKFQEPGNFNNKLGLKYILYWEDSKITYNGYQFNFKKANVISKGSKKKIILTAKDDSKLDINSDNNSLMIRSSNLTGEYVNTIFQKDLVSGGTIEFFMTKDTVDSYQGVVKLKNTTLKDLQFIDNLLLFVNSSPALINPLLGIPALLRFGNDKFTVNGYTVVDGEFKFIYHKAQELLEIKGLKAVGNLNNFYGDLQIDFASNEINGNLNVVFLKDFASIIKYIPLVNKIILDKEKEISLPVTISGTLKDTKFSIK